MNICRPWCNCSNHLCRQEDYIISCSVRTHISSIYPLLTTCSDHQYHGPITSFWYSSSIFTRLFAGDPVTMIWGEFSFSPFFFECVGTKRGGYLSPLRLCPWRSPWQRYVPNTRLQQGTFRLASPKVFSLVGHWLVINRSVHCLRISYIHMWNFLPPKPSYAHDHTLFRELLI